MELMLSQQRWMKYIYISELLMIRECISIFKESNNSLVYFHCSCARAAVVKVAKASRGLQRSRVRILLRTKSRLILQRWFNERIWRCIHVVVVTLIQRCIGTSVRRFMRDVANFSFTFHRDLNFVIGSWFNHRIQRCIYVVVATLIPRCIVTSVRRFMKVVASIFILNLLSPRSQRRNR
jgi:hypothetical protein